MTSRISHVFLTNLLLLFASFAGQTAAQDATEALPDNHGEFNTQLFLSNNAKQPLIVGLGGAEGGNAWAGDYWSDQRERFYLKAMVF